MRPVIYYVWLHFSDWSGVYPQDYDKDTRSNF
jgi:hypothetical protein